MIFNTPVAFIIFNRPDLTQEVFETIRQAQPRQLFVIADGPRFPEEADKCQKARSIIKKVDWDCQVLTNYSETNLGCRQRISSGISWVFEQVEEVIILEDDCLPAPSFFTFCQTLLEYYRDDERVMVISGNNFQNGQTRTSYSYYFSKYNHCWGWATWQRAWKHWDFNVNKWLEFKHSGWFDQIFDEDYEKKYWENIFDRVFLEGKPDSWLYVWKFACWSQAGLSILPNRNLVSNIGFREDGTHTTSQNSPQANIPTADIWEVKHPPFLLRNRDADRYTFDYVLGGKAMREARRWKNRLRLKLSRIKHKNTEAVKSLFLHSKNQITMIANKILNRVKMALSTKKVSSNSLLTDKEISHLSKISRYEPGIIKTKKGKISFVDSCTLIVGNKEIFIDESYKICPTSDSPLIVDCGANIGLASIYFKTMFPNAKIIAIEPDPSIFKCLKDNLKNFGIDEGTTAIEAAVWIHSSGVSFDVEGGFSGQITKHSHSAVKQTIKVPSVRLKDIISASHRVDLLKIDIEGAELEVLEDIASVLDKVDKIFVEYHSHQQETQKLDRILRILSDNSFRYHVKEAYTVNWPFVEQKTMLGMDLQLNIFGNRI